MNEANQGNHGQCFQLPIAKSHTKVLDGPGPIRKRKCHLDRLCTRPVARLKLPEVGHELRILRVDLAGDGQLQEQHSAIKNFIKSPKTKTLGFRSPKQKPLVLDSDKLQPFFPFGEMLKQCKGSHNS